MSHKDTQHVSLHVPEERYSYYRRCQQFLRNGRQCKALAMKETDICRQHAEQREIRQRRERQRAALGLPDFHHDFRTIARAIRMVAQALIDGRIDHQTTGRLLLEIQTASQLSSCLHGAADISCGEPQNTSFFVTTEINPLSLWLPMPRRH